MVQPACVVGFNFFKKHKVRNPLLQDQVGEFAWGLIEEAFGGVGRLTRFVVWHSFIKKVD